MYHTNQDRRSLRVQWVVPYQNKNSSCVPVSSNLELKASRLFYIIVLFYFYSCSSGDLIEQILAMLSWLWAFFRVSLFCLGRTNGVLWCVLVFMCLVHGRLYYIMELNLTSTHNIFLLFLNFWYYQGNYKLCDWD